ncbi:hypothetical protein LVJ94_30100 [Pendulispora rubella]|uniref:Uncharacterized protein n=1 Tax=Pendulispora rubella TaxID=2741070 RepID=A0ABZ2KR54_9BACT
MRRPLILTFALALAGVGACSSEKESSGPRSELDAKQHQNEMADAACEDSGSPDAGPFDGGGAPDAAEDARSPGEEGDPCIVKSDCAYGLWCKKPDGACDGPGTCKFQRHYEATWDGSTVCGCDGRTYTAYADAEDSEVNIASSGFCPDTPTCNDGESCQEGFCKRSGCSGPGRCVVRAFSICPKFVPYYCTCGGSVTTECGAYSSGENLDYSTDPSRNCEPYP